MDIGHNQIKTFFGNRLAVDPPSPPSYVLAQRAMLPYLAAMFERDVERALGMGALAVAAQRSRAAIQARQRMAELRSPGGMS